MHKRICPICEAGCGLNIAADGRTVTAITANNDDVFSGGHICAKGLSLAQLDADPDRLQTPLVKRNGELVPASYEEAFALIAERLNAIRAAHGAQSVAVYLGNPSAHNVGLSMGLGPFFEELGSGNIYSAATVDQIPKQLASAMMFGDGDAIPVPDIERADLLLMLGANPIVSNGSLWMVPGFRDKLRDFKSRGGTFITVDPRRSETARLADTHLGIVPGTDAFLLAALINEMLAQGAAMPVDMPMQGWPELQQALAGIDTQTAANRTGIPQQDITRLATRFMAANRPVVYGRVGTTLQQYGTLTSFLIEVINLLSHALDVEGGAMFPEQAFAEPGPRAPSIEYGRYASRVSGRIEVLGQMPVSVLAEEIEEPGPGQIKALLCFAGNPIVSNPDSDRLEQAIESLEFLVCVDLYHNETTRHADVILPGNSPFEKGHYDKFLGSMGYRNVARYSPPMFESSQYLEWDVGLGLAFALKQGRAPSDADIRTCEDDYIAKAMGRYISDPEGPLYNRDLQELLAMVGPESGVERMLDIGIRAGRYGDHFGKRDGLTLSKLVEHPDGVDLGALRAGRLGELLNTESRKVELAPALILNDLENLKVSSVESSLRLIGRRGTRTNNSWLGNLPMLTKGSRQCTLEVHPADAAALGLVTGDQAELATDQARLLVEVFVTGDVAEGVVSLPHGFTESTDIRQNKQQTGANYNRLIPARMMDEPSGTSALNGFPVSVAKI